MGRDTREYSLLVPAAAVVPLVRAVVPLVRAKARVDLARAVVPLDRAVVPLVRAVVPAALPASVPHIGAEGGFRRH